MKNKTRRLAAFLLSAAVVITAVPGMQERVYAQKTGGYTESPKSENVPVVQETKSRLKKAEAVPSAYMNKLSELTIRYPGVRDQGKYDTCWAFSAIGLAEFDLIADNQTADKSIDLSELQLAYFTYNNVEDPLGGTFGDSLNIMNHKNYLTMGGNLDFASRTLLQWEGVTDENRVPYALAPTTTTLAKSYAFDQDVAHLQNVYIINIHKNATQVKCEIMQHGSAGLGLYMDGTANYVGSAVYAETGENVATYYCPTSSVASNHAVNIVGWDDNFPASSFKNKPAGDGAWLCRNSWSDKTENNINSYFWLSYYDKSIEDAAWIFDFESADNYDYNYQYDGGADVGKLEFSDALLKRIMLLNNEEKGEEYVAENYDKSIEELTWHLIKEQLVEANDIKVEQEDVLKMARETTKAQFAQYGMLSIPDDVLDNYAQEMLKKKETINNLVWLL